MFVAAFAPHAQPGQARPQQLSGFAVRIGQSQPERPIREPELVTGDELVLVEAATGEVGPSHRHGLESLLVITGHLLHERGVIGLGIERAWQDRHGAVFREWP